MNEWMTKRSQRISLWFLYLLSIFVMYWQHMDIIDKIDTISMQMCEISEEMNDLEDAIYDLRYSIDRFYIPDTIVHTHMSDVIEDSKEQIHEEIVEGEIEVLAQLIEAEAGTEDFLGKCLVADVVLNRVRDNSFPNSVIPVIFEHHVRKSDGVDCYQFATVKYGTFEKAGWNISEDSFKAAYQEYYSPKRMDSKILYFSAGDTTNIANPHTNMGGIILGIEISEVVEDCVNVWPMLVIILLLIIAHIWLIFK